MKQEEFPFVFFNTGSGTISSSSRFLSIGLQSCYNFNAETLRRLVVRDKSKKDANIVPYVFTPDMDVGLDIWNRYVESENILSDSNFLDEIMDGHIYSAKEDRQLNRKLGLGKRRNYEYVKNGIIGSALVTPLVIGAWYANTHDFIDQDVNLGSDIISLIALAVPLYSALTGLIRFSDIYEKVADSVSNKKRSILERIVTEYDKEIRNIEPRIIEVSSVRDKYIVTSNNMGLLGREQAILYDWREMNADLIEMYKESQTMKDLVKKYETAA